MNEPQTQDKPWPDGGSWRSLPLGDKILWALFFPFMTFIVGYQIENAVLRQFAYAATKQYPAMELYWLNNPCGDTDHWWGFKATHQNRDGKRVHALVCLTGDGWIVIPRDNG